MPMEMIYTDVVQRLQEFHSAQDPPLPQDAAPHPTHWLPPSLGFYKINYGGAMFQDLVAAWLGVVARDLDRRVIVALSEHISFLPIIEALEALACRKAVAFAIDLDIQDVVFEGDLETIFKHLSFNQPSMAAFGHLVDEACNLAATLRSYRFSHIKRKGYMVADKLAKLVKTLYESTIWFEDIH
nr:uncharacterized protein LOC112003629 [Quercus suber]